MEKSEKTKQMYLNDCWIKYKDFQFQHAQILVIKIILCLPSFFEKIKIK